MRFFIAAVTLLSACAVVPAQPLEVALDQPFRLSAGASARLAGAGLQIRWIGIVSDSRCRRGEQCVSAGNAVVRVEVQGGSSGPQTLDLRTLPGAAPSAAVEGFQLVLVDLEPAPGGTKAGAPAPAAAVATLTVSRHGSAETSK